MNAAWLASIVPALVVGLGCVSPRDVNERMLPYVQALDHAAALAVLEEAEDDYGEKNEVLYHLERGMLHHYAGEYEKSNSSFEIAKRQAELHYTKSITAEASTFFGLAGMGDLAVTAFSQHGRNRAFGERIGRGETLVEILDTTHKIAEGVWTSRVVRSRAQELGVEMPISDAVAAVLFDGVPMQQALQSLMGRDRREEILS